MKHLLLALLIIVGVSACRPREMILESELTGLYRLNGLPGTSYRMEVTPSGQMYWYNYNDVFNFTRVFNIMFDPNWNRMRLSAPGSSWFQHDINVYRQNNGRLYYMINVNTFDNLGHPIVRTDYYYKM
jgi:hypothetical protein